MDLAGSEQAFLDFEREVARDQGLRTLEPDIVGIGPIASTDLVDVARAFGDDERGARAFTFQDRIDRDRGSVHKRVDRVHTDTGFLDAVVNPLLQTRRSGRAF